MGCENGVCDIDFIDEPKEDTYDKIIKHYGEFSQLAKAIEETAELCRAISRYMMAPHPTNAQDIAEEVADCEIMIEQVKRILLIQSEVTAIKAYKLSRQIQRMEADNVSTTGTQEPLHTGL